MFFNYDIQLHFWFDNNNLKTFDFFEQLQISHATVQNLIVYDNPKSFNISMIHGKGTHWILIFDSNRIIFNVKCSKLAPTF